MVKKCARKSKPRPGRLNYRIIAHRGLTVAGVEKIAERAEKKHSAKSTIDYGP